MSEHRLHTVETAPEEAKPVLQEVAKKYGFTPNLMSVMAESPTLLKGYLALGGLLEASSLSPVEQQVVLLAVSRENGCEYCMAAHSTVASMIKAPQETIAALRDGTPIPDAKLEALRSFTTAVVAERGWVKPEAVQAFFDAGYCRANLLEVILGVGMKTLSNYTNHLAETPLDAAF